MLKPVIDRFLQKISVSDSGCWESNYAVKPNGYSQIGINKKFVLVHRFIYEYYYGQICPDLTIDHKCKNKKCCNPLHLEQVTLLENIQRGNGICVINAAKTHCKRGHEFTLENTYIIPKGRKCRACAKLQSIIS